MERFNIAAIRARAEAATPGPWLCADDGWPVWFPIEGEGYVPYWDEGKDESENNPYRPHSVSFPTLDFVAHTREDVPALCYRVEKLETVLEYARQTLVWASGAFQTADLMEAWAKEGWPTLDKIQTALHPEEDE
jgi:hypothetical protein